MSIKAVGRTPNYSLNNINNNKTHSAISFKEKEIDDKPVEYKGRYASDVVESAYVKGGIVGAIVGAFIVFGTQALKHNDENKFDKNIINKFIKTVESDAIKKDSFMVKDVTGDEKPDFVLFKNDGSKVIFDLSDGKIKEEITETKFKEIK